MQKLNKILNEFGNAFTIPDKAPCSIVKLIWQEFKKFKLLFLKFFPYKGQNVQQFPPNDFGMRI